MKDAAPFYGLANFAEGARVRIPDRNVLEEFRRTWTFHHKLELDQLEYANRTAQIIQVQMYHGGDIIYKLKDVPGLWHQHLLSAA